VPARRGIFYGFAAGAAFGLFFVFLRNAGHGASGWGGLWPLVAARGAGTVAVLAAAGLKRARVLRWGRDRAAVLMAIGAGVFDAVANVFYVLATRHGLFSLAVVITSLYPAMTVLLARVVLGERMRRVQRAGLVLAALGIVLVTA
jgi:drug/metabolite transporter (DMT)-like permease